MPQNCSVPYCTKKVYEENSVKISFHKFPDDEAVFRQWIVAMRRDIGINFQVTQNSRVCSRHFKPSDYIRSLTGRKKTLKSSAVLSVFPWMKGSPAKRRARKHRGPIKKKSPKKTSETTTISDSSNSTCASSPVDSRENQESPDLENLDNSSAEEPLDGREEKLRYLESEKAKVEEKIRQLMMEIERLYGKNNSLQAKVFSIDRFITSDKDLSFYTGFPNASVLESILQYLNPGKEGENINYWHSSTDDVTNVNQGSDKDAPKQGRPRQLSPREEFFLTLCRLRQGFKEEHLSHLYGISQATASRIVVSWINFMFLKFSTIPIWPSKEKVEEHMPADLKEKYPSTRVIIDCTEIRCQMPKSLRFNSELFSSYKNHTTLKGLVGISPGGAITFISQLYTGHISDREIVMRSGFLNLPFARGDSVMADKGFTVQDLLPLGVSLNIPPFLGGKGQMTPEEVVQTQQIASL